jgi:UDP-GlcNAc:undecaprenyl-phosphate/decaprenyl-phosphate GlcNAc-1-phosphate transferase
MNNFIFILFVFFINLTFFFLTKKIAFKLNFFDHPDNFRKIHKKKIPAIGGLIFFINISIYFFSEKFFFTDQNFFSANRDLLSFFFGSFFFFLVGLYDDKYTLRANTKFALSAIIILFSINLSDNFLINNLRFEFTNYQIYLNNFSLIFTLFCILVFLNSFNMIDGINGLSVSYYLICISFLFLPLNINLFYISSLVCALFFLINNFRNKIFLGDNGSLLLGFMLSLLFIKFYNEKKILADEIILLMILPGLDLMRVSITRILNNKNAFFPDQNHLHHLLLKKFNTNFSYFVIISLVLISALLLKLINYEFFNLLGILIISLIYFLIICLLKLK